MLIPFSKQNRQNAGHPERPEGESKDPGIDLPANVDQMRRFFDSLRSLRMTKLLDLYVLISYLTKVITTIFVYLTNVIRLCRAGS